MNLRDSIATAQLGAGQAKADGTTTFEFKFRAEDPVFVGHFPGRPILPGVFQLELARFAAELVLKCPLGIREIRKAKFQRPILPEEVVQVVLKLGDPTGTFPAQAHFSVGGQTAGETFLSLWRSE